MANGEDGIIIEFQVLGNAVKVSAVDALTGTEVSLVGPASSPRELLRNNVIRKLRYVLEKKQQ